jgi:NADH-quinone oxidoreductase subunit A
MPVHHSPYWFIAVLLGASVAFCLAPLLLARLWARWMTPAKPGPTKSGSYECGLASAGVESPRFKSEYYLYGLLFLVFDVEAVFLLPFAVSFPDLAPGGFLAMLVFLALLAEGLAWAWLKGLLTLR